MPTDLVSLLDWRAAHQSDVTAFTFVGAAGAPDVSWTYAELAAQARSVAAVLVERCRPGDRVLLLYPPGLPYIAAFFGCLTAGVIAVPAYPPLARRLVGRVLAIVEDARPALALTDEATLRTMEAREDLGGLFSALPVLTVPFQAGLPKIQAARSEAAFLQYTSGSTGSPKGVVVSHANLWHNSALIHAGFGHGPESCALVWLPPFHDMGLVGGILQPFYGGFPGVLMGASAFLKRPLSWLQAISRFKATTSGGPNFAFDLCVDKLRPEAMEGVDLSGWKVAFNGAEPVRAATMARFAEAFAPWGFRPEAFYPCYGMAEATLIISGGSPDHLPVVEPHEGRLLVSSGRILGDQSVRVVDPETRLEVAPGEVGEIWLAGPSVALGYWQRDGDAEFRARLADSDAGPFLRTGDLGMLRHGELFVTGRLKDLIIVDGINHYPQDLEWTAQQSHPALRVDGGAAFSIPGESQEQVVLVQELMPGVGEAEQEGAIAAVRAALSTEHGIAVFAIVLLPPGGLLRTSSGKVQRRACRDAFLAGTLPAKSQWPHPHPVSR